MVLKYATSCTIFDKISRILEHVKNAAKEYLHDVNYYNNHSPQF